MWMSEQEHTAAFPPCVLYARCWVLILTDAKARLRCDRIGPFMRGISVVVGQCTMHNCALQLVLVLSFVQVACNRGKIPPRIPLD